MINNKITQITIEGSSSSSVQFIASNGARTSLLSSGVLSAGENKLLISCEDMSFDGINKFSIVSDIGVTIRADMIDSATNTSVMIYAVDGSINTIPYDITDRIYLGESSLTLSDDGTHKIIYFKMNRLFMNGYEWRDKTLIIEPMGETSLTIFNEINVEASYADESNNSEKTAKLKGSIGCCGQYEMNLASSNMRVHAPLFKLAGKGYPLSCGLHYNEAAIDSDYLEVINEQSKIYSVNTGLPSGIKLDCMQFLRVNLDSVDYVDSYGVKHVFAEADNYASSEKGYYDIKGTGSYLECTTDSYIMTTQFDDKLEFTNSGVGGIFVLTKITNKYGKCLNFVYNPITRYYTSSNDESGRMAEFQYSNGFLSKIIVKENDDTTAERLEYTFSWNVENRTFSITHPNNITAIYTYNEDNYLISMKESTNSADMARVLFERNNVLKINKISEYYGNQLIQEYTVSSGYPKAQVKNNKNITMHYRFLGNGEISESYEEENSDEKNIICKCDGKTICFPTSETTLWGYDNNYTPFSQRLLYTYTKPQENLPVIFSEVYGGKKAIFAVDANSSQYSGNIDFGISFYNAGEYLWSSVIKFEQYEDGKIRKCSFVTIPDNFDRIDIEVNYDGELGEVSVGKLAIHKMTASFYEDYTDFYGGQVIIEGVSDDNSAVNSWYKLGNNTPVSFKTYDEIAGEYKTSWLRHDFHYEDFVKTICEYRKLPFDATSIYVWYDKLKSMMIVPINNSNADLDFKFGIGDNQKRVSEIKCAQIIQQDGYELNDDNDLVSVSTKTFAYSTYVGREASLKRTYNNVTVVTKSINDVETVSIFKETSIYNSNGDLIETCDKNGIITKYTLDNDGEITEVRRYISGNANNTGLRQTSTISDIESSNENIPDLYRTASSSYADGKITTNTQDVELFEGKPYALTAPNGKKTQFEYYSDKTLKKIGVVLGDDENSNSFTYDDRMRVNSVTHGGSVFNFEYDDYNKLKSIYCAENKLLDKNNIVTTMDDTTTLTYTDTDKLMYTYDKYGREVMMSVWESDDNGGRYVDKLINIYCDDNSDVQQSGTDSTEQNSGMRGSVFNEEESDLSPILSLNARTYNAEFLSISNLSKLRRTVDNDEECMYNYMYNNLGQLVKIVKCAFNGAILNVTTFVYDGLKRLVCRKVSDVGDITYTYFDDSLDSQVSNSIVPLTIENYSKTVDSTEFKLKSNVESDLYGRVVTVDNILQAELTHLHKYKDVYEYCYGWSEKHVLPEGMSYIDENGDTQISTGLPIFLKNGTSNKVSKISRYSAGSMVGYDNEPQTTVEFTYNNSGNITQIVEEDKGSSLTYKTGYQYDGLNRLTRENNQKLDKTYTYTYDTNGNILTKNVYDYTTGTIVVGNNDESLNTPVEKSYTYSYDSVWKDRLTAFDGINIDYNSGYAGNPSNYRGKNTSWTRGSLLSTYGNVTFEYNAFGQRIKKTVGDERVHTYEYDGSNLVRENVVYTNPQEDEEDYTLEYVYNHLGLAMMVYSRETHNTEIYHYMKNCFGDVTDMYSASQNFKGLYGTYAYNAYGEFEILTNNRNAATLNPFRYRGYYYDEDLKLYWVGTRLYDPETGRFVCADDVSNLNRYVIGGMNLFAYCLDNPISIIDFVNLGHDDKSNTKTIKHNIVANIPLNKFDVHARGDWFVTDWPGFLVVSKDGFELINWDLSIYNWSLYFDTYENHSLYASIGNVGVYAGLNYEKGIGFDTGASALSIGYDGRILDASLDLLTVGFVFIIKNGKWEFGGGALWGWSISIDFVELFKIISGG